MGNILKLLGCYNLSKYYLKTRKFSGNITMLTFHMRGMKRHLEHIPLSQHFLPDDFIVLHDTPQLIILWGWLEHHGLFISVCEKDMNKPPGFPLIDFKVSKFWTFIQFYEDIWCANKDYPLNQYSKLYLIYLNLGKWVALWFTYSFWDYSVYSVYQLCHQVLLYLILSLAPWPPIGVLPVCYSLVTKKKPSNKTFSNNYCVTRAVIGETLCWETLCWSAWIIVNWARAWHGLAIWDQWLGT